MLIPRDFPQSIVRPITHEELERLGRYTTRITSLRFGSNTRLSPETFENLTNLNSSFVWDSLWPELKTLWWITPAVEHLEFMRCFLPHGVRSLKVDMMNAKVRESLEALSLVKARCTQLTEFGFYGLVEQNEGIQDLVLEIILQNSRTLRFLRPPVGSFSEVVEAALGLPALEKLEMHVPEVGWLQPVSCASLHSLEWLILTLDEPKNITHLLGNVRGSKLRAIDLRSPYLVQEDDLKSLAYLFKLTGFYDSLKAFSWNPLGETTQSLTWQFVTILTPFVNVHTLILGANCDGACRFSFKHKHVVELSKQMPQLKDLNFGGKPCAYGGSSTDIGFKTFVELGKNCPGLFRFSVHFNPYYTDLEGYMGPKRNLVHWDVGDTALPEDPELFTMIALAAVMLFPRATIVGDMQTDPSGWCAVREEFELLSLPPVFVPPDLTG